MLFIWFDRTSMLLPAGPTHRPRTFDTHLRKPAQGADVAKLNTSPNFTNSDDFYAALLALHAGKSTDESAAINARLILLLANHIGDAAVLSEALHHAGKTPQE